ncbi:MAG: indole-3-glycerol-phosphate synthase [Chloroflexi bacterium]|nr:indole-3-glycerol-phosphate synthase [Chloroflexota bacterium]
MKLTQAIKRAREKGEIPLIAEIKVRSPKDGDLLKDRDPVQIATEYIRGGACAVSVVTEPLYFGGNIEILRKIAAKVKAPILRKDFIKERDQVWESKQLGAQAVLLISAMLAKERLTDLNEYAHSLGLETVVEIHTMDELKNLNGLTLDMVGINNKDILDLERGDDQIIPTESLAPLLPEDVIVISESAIRNEQNVKEVMRSGADAILMGTALMASEEPRVTVANFVHVQGAANDQGDDLRQQKSRRYSASR